MVRMQSDARLPAADRLGYKHIGDALFRIAKEEGVRTYWRGATPTGKKEKEGHETANKLVTRWLERKQ